MKELLEFILKSITGSDEVTVEETVTDSTITFKIHAPQEMVGIIIGKEGKTIKAIRSIVRVRATLEQKLVNIEIAETEVTS